MNPTRQTHSITERVPPSLKEDMGSGDITAQLFPRHQRAQATIFTREPMVLCGVDWVQEVYQQVDSKVRCHWHVKEGEFLPANTELVTLMGLTSSLLTGERCALNWLQTLSGTSTVVHRYVQALEGYRTQLLDTRKTIPGMRYAQKYAVKVGGAKNHRLGLYDAYLIKENHIASCGSITQAVQRARQQGMKVLLEVEVENLMQLEEAIAARVDRVMLDNFTLIQIQEAVAFTKGRVELEVSGNVDLENIIPLAKTGVDFISIGALTKHVQSIDLSMRITVKIY